MGLKLQISMDFVLTILVFITLVTYFLFYLLSERNVSVANLNRDKKFTKAIAISQVLVNDYGEPKDWETLSNPDDVKRVGLLNESYEYPNYVSMIKAQALKTMFCNSIGGYNRLKSMLGLNNKNVVIIIKSSDGTLYICPNPALGISLGSPENITRKAFDRQNNQTVTIFVAVGD